MTVDLAPFLAAVPDVVAARLRAARSVLAVGHEHPDADTLGATLAVCRLVEAHGGRATAVCSDPIPPLYAFLPDIERFRTEPEPDRDYDLLVVSDCGSLERVGAVGVALRGPAGEPAPGRPRPSRQQRGAAAQPTGSTPARPPPARWSPSWRPGSGCRWPTATEAWRPR